MPSTEIGVIKGYHAHVYFDECTVAPAQALRALIEETFDIKMGRFHEKPVGPHPQWSYQVAFEPEQFAALIPWLALNRNGLDVFVHPESGDSLADHTDHVMWLGNAYELDIESLKRAIGKA